MDPILDVQVEEALASPSHKTTSKLTACLMEKRSSDLLSNMWDFAELFGVLEGRCTLPIYL